MKKIVQFFKAVWIFFQLGPEKIIGLRQQASRDFLTGIDNRRSLQEKAIIAIAQARRHNYPVSVVVADVDGFKKINDTQGHLAGDRILRRAGQLFKSLAREGDIVARYGGDEFVAVLPYANAEGAQSFILRVQEAFATESIGLSFGIICLDSWRNFPGEMSAEAIFNMMFAEADDKMYRQKQAKKT